MTRKVHSALSPIAQALAISRTICAEAQEYAHETLRADPDQEKLKMTLRKLFQLRANLESCLRRTGIPDSKLPVSSLGLLDESLMARAANLAPDLCAPR